MCCWLVLLFTCHLVVRSYEVSVSKGAISLGNEQEMRNQKENRGGKTKLTIGYLYLENIS